MSTRVLVLSFGDVPGLDAAGQHLTTFLPTLARDASVDAMSTRTGSHNHIEQLGSGRMLRVPLPEGDVFSQIASFQRAVRRQLDGEEYDLIYCTDIFSAHATASHRAIGETPLLISLFSFPNEGFYRHTDFPPLDDRARANLQQHVVATLDRSRCIAVPSAMAGRYLGKLGYTGKYLVKIPPAVDTSLFAPSSVVVRPAPEACLIAALVQPWRRPFVEELLGALARLPEHVQLRLLAEEPAGDFAPSLIEKHGLEERVQIAAISSLDSLALHLRAVDIAVVWLGWTEAALETGFIPIALLDSLATGLPTVATRCVAAEDLLPPLLTEWLCPKGDVATLADHLEKLVASSALRNRLSRIGNEWMSEQHRASRVYEQMRQIFEAALGTPLSAAPSPSPEGTPTARRQHFAVQMTQTPIVPNPIALTGGSGIDLGAGTLPPPRIIEAGPLIDGAIRPDDPWSHDTDSSPFASLTTDVTDTSPLEIQETVEIAAPAPVLPAGDPAAKSNGVQPSTNGPLRQRATDAPGDEDGDGAS